MRTCLLLLVFSLVLVSTCFAQSSDTLLDVRQWTVAVGGNDHYYGIIPIVQPWIYQNALAQTLTYAGEPGYLASIRSAEENAFIESLMADHTDQPSITDEFYIGGWAPSGSWLWTTGELFSYARWEPGEPNGDGPALAIWGMSQGSKAGYWNDVPEDTVGHSSIQQLWALVEFGPLDTDVQDTLIDVRQWTVAEGGNDHYYGVIPIVQPWVYQNALAQTLTYNDEPGYLATIRSYAENAFIESLMADHTDQPSITDEFYIGGDKLTGSWQWGTGEPFSYVRWANGEPSGDGPALAIWGMSQGSKAGYWNDGPEDTVGHTTIHQLWALVEFGPPDTTTVVDTLINLVQWPASQGGNDHWYGVVSLELFWEEANSLVGTLQVGSDSGYLATITSSAENQFILNSVIAGTNQPSILDEFWLGGVLDDSVFAWQTLEPLIYVNWASGEPNNLPDESVLAMWGYNSGHVPGTWNNALPDDAIHDLHQWWAVVEFGAPSEPVTDTLIDVRQWSVAAGGNDHYYGIVPIVQPWVNHAALAPTLTYNGEPGYLATIRSVEENSFIESLMADHTDQPSITDEFYIGGSSALGSWQWLTGEYFSYARWESGEPSGDGPAIAIWGMSQGSKAGYWNDVPEDTVGHTTIQQLWALVEFGPLDPETPDTLIDVRQWTVAEGGNNHYYGIISIVQPWVDHVALAPTLTHDGDPGYLATIRSVEENAFIESLMADHTGQPSVADEFYIGGSKATGSWAWLTGESFGYTRWETGEPSGDGTALAIWGMSQGVKAGYWNDAPADTAGVGSFPQLWAVVEFGIPCCIEVTGNINNDPNGRVNLSDLTLLVNYLFLNGPPLPCPSAANTSGDIGCIVSLTDVTLLVNHLFVTYEPLAPCNPACE